MIIIPDYRACDICRDDKCDVIKWVIHSANGDRQYVNVCFACIRSAAILIDRVSSKDKTDHTSLSGRGFST